MKQLNAEKFIIGAHNFEKANDVSYNFLKRQNKNIYTTETNHIVFERL